MTESKAATKRFTADEQAAMRERAREVKAAAGGATGESELLAKIAEMKPADRAMAQRIHSVITTAAPGLTSTTWYGMPAYAREGKTICFFQPASKFKTRYATLGFSDKANLDDGGMWPNAYAISELTPAVEKQIAALVKRAIGGSGR